jgi:mannose-6-phosphate isomerase-like protein (cupin superfamily)
MPGTTPATPAAAQPRPRRAPAAPAGRTGIAMTVTDDKGATLPDIHVELTGASKNAGDTNSAGQVNFPGLQPGTYRLRFTGDHVMGFEREVTLRAGKIENLTIELTPVAAPKPVVEKAPAPPPAPTIGPLGSPQLGSVTNLADREKNTKDARHEVLLSCSANTRNMLVVLTQEQPERLYENAESTFYVLSGQGSAKVGALQSVIGTGTFISVPRGTSFSLARQGKSPLMLLWTLSGEPCEQAR